MYDPEGGERQFEEAEEGKVEKRNDRYKGLPHYF